MRGRCTRCVCFVPGRPCTLPAVQPQPTAGPPPGLASLQALQRPSSPQVVPAAPRPRRGSAACTPGHQQCRTVRLLPHDARPSAPTVLSGSLRLSHPASYLDLPLGTQPVCSLCSQPLLPPFLLPGSPRPGLLQPAVKLAGIMPILSGADGGDAPTSCWLSTQENFFTACVLFQK